MHRIQGHSFAGRQFPRSVRQSHELEGRPARTASQHSSQGPHPHEYFFGDPHADDFQGLDPLNSDERRHGPTQSFAINDCRLFGFIGIKS